MTTLKVSSASPSPRLETRRPFTRADALAAGIPARDFRGSKFRRILHGVYIDAHVPDHPLIRPRTQSPCTSRGFRSAKCRGKLDLTRSISASVMNDDLVRREWHPGAWSGGQDRRCHDPGGSAPRRQRDRDPRPGVTCRRARPSTRPFGEGAELRQCRRAAKAGAGESADTGVSKGSPVR